MEGASVPYLNNRKQQSMSRKWLSRRFSGILSGIVGTCEQRASSVYICEVAPGVPLPTGMDRQKAGRHMKGDIDRVKHDDDYAEHTVLGAHVHRTGAAPRERSTSEDRPKKSRAKSHR